jgi:hypothetical protein
MRLRFQADADLNQLILHAVIRREPALDFQTAAAAGLAGLRDPAVLTLAARDGRVLVTHDQNDAKPFAAFSYGNKSGVLIIPQRLRRLWKIYCSFGPSWTRRSGEIPSVSALWAGCLVFIP